ncbi:MAG: type II toxin-antitoxin system VapC family toxin [Myxococcales bacterium]|nr:type II toxin-antitoxin system VapC family toxin [Myxococcales bacterium]
MILVDTCVISELARRRPSPSVVAWFENVDEQSLYISALTLGEIAKGAASHPDPARRLRLDAWLEQVRLAWAPRTLTLTSEIALEWGRLVGRLARSGTVMPVLDGLIAATARRHGLHIATRNVSDFEAAEVLLFNPWQYT